MLLCLYSVGYFLIDISILKFGGNFPRISVATSPTRSSGVLPPPPEDPFDYTKKYY